MREGRKRKQSSSRALPAGGVKRRGIYSDQFAELGKGEKNQPLKKKGEKISQGNDDKKGIKEKRGGKNREKREAVGKRGKQWEKEGRSGKKEGSSVKKRRQREKRGKQRQKAGSRGEKKESEGKREKQRGKEGSRAKKREKRGRQV